MGKSTLIVSFGLYALSISMILMGTYVHDEINYTKIIVGATLMIIPWAICLINAVKTNKSALWISFLAIMGAVAIPFYIRAELKESKVLI